MGGHHDQISLFTLDVMDDLLSGITGCNIPLYLQSGEFIDQKLVKHSSQAICLRLPNKWLYRQWLNMKEVNRRVKVTRVGGNVCRRYLALGREFDGKQNAFEVDHL
jgi:hypothetical protein